MAQLRHTDWPARLWIVRHGESAGNVARDAAEAQGMDLIDIVTRDADVPLSDLGTEQAAALGRWFSTRPPLDQPTVLMSSPFVRAQQTCAAVAAALAIPLADVQSDERLREKEFGVLDLHTRQGIVTKFPELATQRARVGKFYFRPPGGESWCDVILRVRSIVEVLRRDHVEDRVLIVAHQVIVNCFRYLLEGMDEAQILAVDREGDVPNCGVTEYGFDHAQPDARFALRAANMVLPLVQAGAEVTIAPDTPAGPK